MGTEIFPVILFFVKSIVVAVGAVAILVIIIASIQHYFFRGHKEKTDEMKDHIVTSLIALTIALIVYFLLSGIGPVFRVIFTRH